MQWTEVRNHQLERQRLLAELKTGKRTPAQVQTSTRRLLDAAQFHGDRQEKPCPVCGKQGLYNVIWIFGENLGKIAGTARSRREVDLLCRQYDQITAHLVEVCVQCRWNVLVSEYHVVSDTSTKETQ